MTCPQVRAIGRGKFSRRLAVSLPPMSPPPLIVIHERIGFWHRQLRPRFLMVDPALRWVESRSGDDLATAVCGVVCPIILLDLGETVAESLDALDRGMLAAPGALTLVLDRDDSPDLAILARELGASHVISGPARPPEVFDLMNRWLSIARRRTESGGWAMPVERQPEAWEDADAFAARWLSRAKWARR